MKKICVVAISIICVSFLLSGRAYCVMGDIINSFVSPGFDPRGLAWDGTNLWHADAFDNLIYKLDPTTGSVISSFNTAGPLAEDMDFVGSELWNIDISTRKFYSVDPNVGPPWTEEFSKPFNDYMGLTYDGTNLWANDGLAGGDIIVKMDLSGNILTTYPAPGNGPRGLAWDGTYLWSGDVSTDMIYKIDPATGNVIDSFAAPGGQTTGMTYDGQYLWVADTMTGQIYQMDLGYTPAPPGIITLLTMLTGLGGVKGLGVLRNRKRKSV